MKAELVADPPAGAAWVFEPKYDGMRCVPVVTAAGARLYSNEGHDCAKQLPEVVEALTALRAAAGADLVLDGEIVACSSDGYAGYEELSLRLGVQSPFRIKLLRDLHPVALVVFDFLVTGEKPLIGEPLTARRTLLHDLLKGRTGSHLRMAEQSHDAETMRERAYAEGWEGIMGKKAESRYFPGKRGPGWIKWKPKLRQEFVIVGFSESGRREHLGALHLGYYQNQQLVYAGKVGSGFSRKALEQVGRALQPLIQSQCPLSITPKLKTPAVWVVPRLVAEVKYDSWTTDGRLRFPRFKGLRTDKPALAVVRETAD